MSGDRGRLKRGFELPSVINPGNTVCVQFQIPNAPEYRRAVLGHVQELGKWYVWEKTTLGDTRASEAAQIFRDLFLETLEIKPECEPMPPTIDFDFREDCILYVSFDGGIEWQAVPGWSTYALGCFKGDPGEPGVDGADGLPGAPGEAGCSPFVWVEDRPADNHKILHIDNDCDEVNEYSIDLTAEQGTGNEDLNYWVCRFARAVGAGIADALLGAETGALPVWSDTDSSIFKPIFLTTFRNYGLLAPTGGLGGFTDIACEILWAQGYQYNADLADACQDIDEVVKAMTDIMATFTTPEITFDNMFAYLDRTVVEPIYNPTPLQQQIAQFFLACWQETPPALENWAWNKMGNPPDMGCYLLEEQKWTHIWNFGEGGQEFIRTTGIETEFGLQTEVILQANLLDFRWAPEQPLTITDVSMTATVIGSNGLAQLAFRYVGNPNFNPILGENIDQENDTRTYHFSTPYENVNGVQVVASDTTIDGTIVVTRLVLRGTGFNPFE